MISVLPEWELPQHERTTACQCDPELDFVEGEMLLIHRNMAEQRPGDKWGVFDDR